jgi:hypothetical protein
VAIPEIQAQKGSHHLTDHMKEKKLRKKQKK